MASVIQNHRPFRFGSRDPAADEAYDRIRAHLEEMQSQDYVYRLAIPCRRDRDSLRGGPGPDLDE